MSTPRAQPSPDRDLSDWVVRGDLMVVPAEDGTGCLVSDPRSGQEFRFGEMEAFLFAEMSAPRGDGTLAAAVASRFKVRCSPQDIDGFRRLLHGWGLLRPGGDREDWDDGFEGMLDGVDEEDLAAAAAEPEEEKHLAAPNRLHLFNPRFVLDLLNEAAIPLRFFFLASVPVLFVLGLILATRHFELFMDAVELSTKQYGFVGKLLMTTITVNIAAQIARGLVARHFGLAVPSFGIWLELGIVPRFNMQVIPKGRVPRHARLWLSATPSLVRLGLFGLGLAVWRIARYSSTLSLLGATVASIAFIGLAFSANPLWRSDGVAFFSSLLEIPDLRARSQRMFWDMFRRRPAVVARHHARGSKKMLIYGFGSILFLYVVFGYMAFNILVQLEKYYSGAGVAAFLALAAYVAYSIRKVQRAHHENRKKRSPPAASPGEAR